MKQHFKRLLEYNAWANRQVLMAMKQTTVPDEINRKMCHILWAEWAWLQRIGGKSVDKSTQVEYMEISKLEDWLLENEENWNSLIIENQKFDHAIHYQLLNGTPAQSTLADIATHIVNHGSYHRGQIATLLRQEGLTPNPTDFIIFTRQ